MDVVLAPVEELADLLVRRTGGVGRRSPVAGQDCELVGDGPAAAAQVHQQPGHGGQPGGELVQVTGGDAAGGELLAEGVAQFGGEPGGVRRGEVAGVHTEGLGEPQQDRDGERAGVVLQLVEVAGREFEQPGQGRLAEPAVLAQPAQARAGEGPSHRAVSAPRRPFGCLAA